MQCRTWRAAHGLIAASVMIGATAVEAAQEAASGGEPAASIAPVREHRLLWTFDTGG